MSLTLSRRNLHRNAAIAFCALALLAPDARAQLEGDAERGRAAFQICQSCHDIGAGAVNRTGPHLNGLLGRPAGQIDGFASSLPMTAAGLRGLVWDDVTLAAYLEDPQALVPMSDMPLIGVFNAQERSDLISYIKEAGAPGETRPARPNPVTHR